MNRFAQLICIQAMVAGALCAAPAGEGDPVNGAKVWADTCVRCHNIRPPSNLSERAWRISMQHMRVRANLTGKEARDTLAFILESKE
ncbi:hypothetical protein LOH54_01770 [Sulfurimonas sp. HSL-3221]|uniref:hypothetical protein n=1 Tax=Sulfurimonadaceae TaxID=2771471 RepID=UPI001E29839F|nr:hypothetical protein [Sulfurimonas sp. HSL-3221]UFS62870.1 hypothetical protein LOH54_01770 [Sulfurimonas sp. HSL-3221]